MHRVAKLPSVGNKKKVEQVKTFKKLTKKMAEMQKIFFHFMNSEYIYDNDTGIKVWNLMSVEEKAEFPFDIRLVNWNICLPGFAFGIRRYFLREDCLSPESGFNQVLRKNQTGWFVDIRTAARSNTNLKYLDNSGYFEKILNQLKY